MAADTGNAAAAARWYGRPLTANAGDDAKGAGALVVPAHTVAAFHFFLPPFLPIGFWGLAGPVYLGMALALGFTFAGLARFAQCNGDGLLLRLACLHLSFDVGRDGLLRATLL